MFYFNLSLHSLLTNRRQYISLFLVCMAGVTIILFASFVSQGMLKSVKQKAIQYYGGELQFLGGENLGTTCADETIEELKAFVPERVQFYKRFNYDAANTSFFFEGESVRQRVIMGVDFNAEKDLFSHFVFESGNAQYSGDYDMVLLSSKIASKLGVKTGDTVTVQMRTIHGYTNTREVQVQGIFLDSSMFGMYTSYMNLDALRSLSDYDSSYVNRICLYYGNGGPDQAEINKLQKQLETKFNMYPLCNDKNEFYHALLDDKSVQKPLYGLITLDANIKELHMITDAIKLVFVLITVVLILIIAVGIGSTYRVIVMKRTTEIGTYRALGMKPEGVRTLFLTEILLLLIFGFIAGICLALIAVKILSLFNLSFIPAFDLFLSEGHLVPSISVLKMLEYLAIIIVTTMLSVLFTIRNIVHLSPVGALATTN